MVEAVGLEFHSRKNQTGRSLKPDLEVEAKKRRRTSDSPNLVGSNDGEREDMSSGSKYEAHSEEEQGSDYEAESNVDENVGEGDGRPIISCERVKRRPSYSSGEGCSGGECKRQDGSSTAVRQGRAVELNRDEVSTNVGNMVQERMLEWEKKEMVSRVLGRLGKKRRFFCNNVSVIVALCDENNGDYHVGIWVKIYAFVILSGVLFPRTPYEAAWGMLHYTENIQQMEAV
ncbi:hypothetical protein Cgig2_000300 [Carnegiea gigantea]|uniref:Uncharacterized protein n=1 Tax=Carnegiea gigantea TaxID=171969 RepID=A0A9Q1K2K6_9CARY|nr:hypothetical protein Cgig2_000300 [Carnegiea gigantea]